MSNVYIMMVLVMSLVKNELDSANNGCGPYWQRHGYKTVKQ